MNAGTICTRPVTVSSCGVFRQKNVEVPLPKIAEDTVTVIESVPQERSQECLAKEVIDDPVPQVMEEIVEVVKHVPHRSKCGIAQWSKSLMCHFHRFGRKMGR